MTKFAERLRESLKQKNLTQDALSKRLGFTDRTVNRWCLGQREPDFDTLLKICKTLDETPNYLLGYED